MDGQIDFWCIGAQKSGTTWLYQNLKKVNHFQLPPIKELHFFDASEKYPSSSNENLKPLFKDRITTEAYRNKAYKRLMKSLLDRKYDDFKFYLKWYFYNYNDKSYLSLFSHYKRITGEITPAYAMLDENDIRRMYLISPKAKIIYLLRDPIQRAWSNYIHNNKKIINKGTFSINEDRAIKFIKSPSQSLRSDYMRSINRYINVFGSGSLMLGFYDAIKDNPVNLLYDITQFITPGKHYFIDEKHALQVIHKSKDYPIPIKVLEYLKTRYRQDIEDLANKYGGYFIHWRNIYYENSCLKAQLEYKPTMIVK